MNSDSKSVAMGRANNNRKVPRHRIISYSREALVNERALFFVKDGSALNGFAASPRVMSVESNASWLMKEGSKSFLRVLASLDGKDIATIGSALALKAIGKMTKADLQFINQYRKSLGHAEFRTLKELANYFFGLPDLVVEFDSEVTKLLFDKGTKKELVTRRSALKGLEEEDDG